MVASFVADCTVKYPPRIAGMLIIIWNQLLITEMQRNDSQRSHLNSLTKDSFPREFSDTRWDSTHWTLFCASGDCFLSEYRWIFICEGAYIPLSNYTLAACRVTGT